MCVIAADGSTVAEQTKPYYNGIGLANRTPANSGNLCVFIHADKDKSLFIFFSFRPLLSRLTKIHRGIGNGCAFPFWPGSVSMCTHRIRCMCVTLLTKDTYITISV